ncbi:TetR/AcrR family transcriptional regulator [Sphingobium sp. AntQ-1]|uniref:TetR/AcrR family transcriptional regulator n=1 Tax=Sphingobium sp. AntQ-1 TaxID=2930091 RepID=UPI00234ED35A|nr:TetR/AcrR family transcriptional regulator [Sphingobium sp. AntQ-1]
MQGRRTQAERSEQTRDRVLTAAIAVMSKRGYAGFRVTEVAEVAGVSIGAQLHHFPTKHVLIAAALTRIFMDARIAAQEHVSAIQRAPGINMAQLVDLIVADATSFYFSENFRFALDMSLAASRDIELANTALEIVSQQGPPMEEIWINSLKEAGVGDKLARDTLSFLWSVIRGLVIRALSVDEPERQRRVIIMARDMMLDHINLAHAADG